MSTTDIKHFFSIKIDLSMQDIPFKNIYKTYVFIVKFEVLWPLLPEGTVQLFTLSLLVFYDLDKECPLKNASNFPVEVLQKFPVKA